VTHDAPAWLGLEEVGEGHWTFELTSPLGRGDGKLYGGTGIAVAVALQEAVTQREALWTTAQFVGSANVGDRLDCDVAVLAHGRRSSQLKITLRHGDRVVVVALGAAGAHGDTPLEAQVPVMPDVPGPDDADDFIGRMQQQMPELTRSGWSETAELRRLDLPDDGLAMWGRMRHAPLSRPAIAFMADFVPLSVARVTGALGGGISLDNSMRFGRLVDSEWVLYDYDPHFATGGYLHGGVRAWAQDGTLLGYASQTAAGFVHAP
jgi:acyl-CoA thioesterase